MQHSPHTNVPRGDVVGKTLRQKNIPDTVSKIYLGDAHASVKPISPLILDSDLKFNK